MSPPSKPAARKSVGGRGPSPDASSSGVARRAGTRATRGSTLAAARAHALSLPGTEELPHRKYTSFRVRGRIYATAPPEGGFLHVFVDEAARQAAIALAPEAVGLLHWGAKAVGVRVNLALASAARIERLLEQAWLERAPKAVVAAWEGR